MPVTVCVSGQQDSPVYPESRAGPTTCQQSTRDSRTCIIPRKNIRVELALVVGVTGESAPGHESRRAGSAP